MRSFVTLLLLALTSCNFINEREVQYLKENAPYEVYDVNENPFKDWTEDEIRGLFGVVLEDVDEEEKENEVYVPSNDLPESFDGREQWPNCVQDIRDQQRCGSCWAFSSATAFAQRICKATEGKTKVVLSAQHAVSCDPNNFGCQGGYLDKNWEFIEDTGLCTESCYPYESGNGTTTKCTVPPCKDGSEWKVYKAKNTKDYTNADAIKKAVYEDGYIQTGFTVYSDFMSYKSGIYEHKSGYIMGGHAVVIVGWGVENGVHYWIAQNSWGASWGEKGFFRIKFGQCGFDSRGIAGLYAQ
jgi:cathepsin B